MPLSFDDLVDVFEQDRGLPPAVLRAFADLVAALTANAPVARVIEPGIGAGRLALPLLVRGLNVTGADISRPMLDWLAARTGGLPGRCDPVRARATALPFPDATFDLGYAASLFYLIPAWQRALAELARVVKPGGFVLFCRERSDLSPALIRFDAAWRESLDAAGVRQPAMAPDDEAVIRAMADRIGPSERRVLAHWTIGQTAAAALDGYGARLRPLYAAVPDAIWTKAVESFTRWAMATFPDPATRLDCQVAFEVAVARVS